MKSEIDKLINEEEETLTLRDKSFKKMQAPEDVEMISPPTREVYRFGKEEDEYRNRFGLMDLSWQMETDIDRHRNLRNEFLNRWRNFRSYCRNSYPEYWKFNINDLKYEMSKIIDEKNKMEMIEEKLSSDLQEALTKMTMVSICKRIRTDTYFDNEKEQEMKEKIEVYG